MKGMHYTGWGNIPQFSRYIAVEITAMRMMDRKSAVDTDFFDGQEWYVRLLLEGEDRLAKNRKHTTRKG